MRKPSIILLLTFFSQQLLAQLQPKMKLDPKNLQKYFHKKKPEELNGSHWPLRLATIAYRGDTARFSHTVTRGDIYRLPIDNMPCLRPDTTAYQNDKAKMVERVPLNNNMPNAFMGKRLFWEKRP